MQTNKINGENALDIINGVKPQLPLIDPNMHPSTPNQRIEAAGNRVGYYALIASNETDSRVKLQLALTQSIDLLNLELLSGHMVQEVFTDSHAPIWLRARLSTYLFVRRVFDSTDSSIVRLRNANENAFELLRSKLEDWFEYHLSCLNMGLIPSGPLAGVVLLPCARKRGMTKDDGPKDTTNKALYSPGVTSKRDSKSVGSLERDVWRWLASGSGPKVKTGPEFWTLSKDRQDSASGPIMRLLNSDLGPNLRRGGLPKLPAQFELERHQDGHRAIFPRGIPKASDAANYLNVNYETGAYSFMETNPVGMRLSLGVIKSYRFSLQGEPV